MPLWKKTLWNIRIWFGIREVKHLAALHPFDRQHQIKDAHDALSVFEEHSSSATHILKTTEEEGELVEELFARQWSASRRNP